MRAKLVALTLGLVLVGCETNTTGPNSSFYGCAMGDATQMSAGQVLSLGGAGGVCLADAGGAGDYVIVPFMATTPASDTVAGAKTAVDILAGGIGASSGGLPDRAPLAPGGPPLFDLSGQPFARQPDEAFDVALRRREIRDLTGKIHPAGPGGGSGMRTMATSPSAVPSVGDLVSYNTAAACSSSAEDIRTGRVRAVSQYAIIVEDTTDPAPGLSQSDVNYFAATMDTLVYPVDTGAFGTPSDIDSNGGRTIIFFTSSVNERTPANSQYYIGGFFWAGDLFPHQSTSRLSACPGSNEAEIFYALAPDPNGVINGNVFNVDFVRRVTVSTLGHEFQHLINASRRLFVNNANVFEDVWLNEGLSHIAEELLFYAAAHLQPGLNLTLDTLRSSDAIRVPANEFVVNDLSRYISFLERPDTASVMGIDNLAMRGAIWSFLRYAADRSGSATFFYDLDNSTTAGVANLRNVIGSDPLQWMRDWAVSIYADDAVPGVDPVYTQPSWNFRSVLPALTNDSTFPLRVHALSAGSTLSFDLLPGGTAFSSFSLDAGHRGVIDLSTDAAARKSLRGSLIRIR
ncbi:MAG TPA: hypothetical protein VJ957_10555 [Longimicrobiales bacterium]|nr:hypothetical protein [Longimicrobiales bacterium]